MSETWLAHHGILGQKWGIRRFQNKDGSLTPAGERRYETNVEQAQQKVYDAKNAVKNETNPYRIDKQKKELQYAKEDLQNEKIKERLNSEQSVSAHRQKLQDQYKKQGMSEEEAAIAAYKRARTEKILAVAGVMTVAAIGTYVAAKHLDKYTDKILDKNVVLHNISGNENKGVEDAFYAAFKGSDRLKYRGMYGDVIKKDKGQVIDTAMNLKDTMKVASEKSGAKVLKETMERDPEFRKDVEKEIQDFKSAMIWGGGTPKQMDVLRKAESSLKKGKIDDNVFKAVNLGLVDHSERGERVSKKFYDALKSKGYDAITDVNDKRLSGYNAKAPIIVFNGKSKIESVMHNKLDNKKLAADKGKAYALNIFEQTMNDPWNQATIGFLAGGAAIGAVNTRKENQQRDSNYVKKYRRDHPETELSYTEIIRNRDRKKR